MSFEIKDSGKRAEFAGGMVRDVTTDKIDYTLITDGPMFDRWAEHLTTGAKKYAKRNWLKAEGQAELDRFRESAFRHFMQWYRGSKDEDHAAAVFFNINGAEYVEAKKKADVAISLATICPVCEKPKSGHAEVEGLLYCGAPHLSEKIF